MSAARHVWRYLVGSKYLAINASRRTRDNTTYVSQADSQIGTESIFYGASDAAFADDEATRQSSYGYLFKLYGMCIDWKATRQRCVTKSTTEAELVALSAAGGEMEWWNRVFSHIQFSPDIRPVIYCDNEQTVGIVTKRDDRLHTKLRHVDTHQMWLRQEVQANRLQVMWCPTTEMPADGLTKTLPRQRHDRFIKQLGLEDVQSHVTGLTQTKHGPEPADLAGWY